MKNKWILMALPVMFFFTKPAFAQEQLTVTMYYPSPYGVYQEIRADRVTIGWTTPAAANSGELTWGTTQSRGKLSADQGSSIELGSNLASVTPYIDFSRSASDYDARIMLIDANRLGIYVRNRLELRNSVVSTLYADIEIRELYLCEY
ncbi:MAG: hypothetical protein WC732_04780 [Candidatus Omnitrophota bacterium]